MKKVDSPPPQQVSSRAAVSDTLKVPAVVPTPSGTLSITLSPPPTPSVPLHQNVSLWVGVITFLGVVLSLFAAERRTKKELRASEERIRLERQFSSERAHQERITSTRRAVYLELIDELLNLQQFFGTLGAGDDMPDVRSGLGGLARAVSKMSLVGEMDTVIMSRELVMAVNQTLAKAMPLALRARFQSQIVKHHREQCNAATAELNRLLAEMRGSEDGASSSKELQHALEEAKAKAEGCTTMLLGAVQETMKAQQSYADLIVTDWNALNQKLDELIHAIRTELGLETSLERLSQSTAQMGATTLATQQDLFTNTKLPSTIQEAMAMLAADRSSTMAPSR